MQQPLKEVGGYILQKKLGDGGFGEVWCACKTRKDGEDTIPIGQPVAIKCMNKERLKKKGISTQNVEREVKLLMIFNHPRIAKFYEHIETENTHYLVFKLYRYQDLEKYVKNERKGSSFMEPEALERLHDLKIGYEQLRARNVIHRDLKPANIFVDEKDQFVIGDLGFARHGHEFHNQLGTQDTMAPELLRGSGDYSEMVDMWSLGIIFYWMLFQKYPWGAGKSKAQLLADIQAANGRSLPLQNHSLSSECVQLLQTMLTEDLSQRLRWDAFFKHPIFLRLAGKVVTENQLPIEAKNPEFIVSQTQYTTIYESERYQARIIFSFCKELRKASKLKEPLLGLYKGFLLCYAYGTLKAMRILDAANKSVQTLVLPQSANSEPELRKFIDSGEHHRMVNMLDADCYFFHKLLEHAVQVVGANKEDLIAKDGHPYASDFEKLRSEGSITEISKALQSHLEWIVTRLNKPDMQGRFGLDSPKISELRDLVIKNTAYIHLILSSHMSINVRCSKDIQELEQNLANPLWLAEVAQVAGVHLCRSE